MTESETEQGRSALDEILRHLSRSRGILQGAVESVSMELRQQRPEPTRWSVAEVLEHLVLVEGWVGRLLRRSASNPGKTPVDSIALDVNRVRDRSHAIQTVPSAIPSRGLDWQQAWQE